MTRARRANQRRRTCEERGRNTGKKKIKNKDRKKKVSGRKIEERCKEEGEEGRIKEGETCEDRSRNIWEGAGRGGRRGIGRVEQ